MPTSRDALVELNDVASCVGHGSEFLESWV